MENRKVRRIVKFICLTVFAACLIPLGQACCESMANKARQDSLRKMREEKIVVESFDVQAAESVADASAVYADEIAAGTFAAQTDEGRTAVDDSRVMLSGYIDLYRENNDLVGWLSIEGMKIDYPVMQNVDDEFYLHHDFYGNDSKYGCLYVRNQADIDAGTNVILYGHNMKDGSMFGDLDLYLKESFYKEHPEISFDTLYEERTYEIIAVFRSQVYNAEDDVFKYYEFYEADTKEEFDDFYDSIRKLSLYDTGVEAEFGDTFLTLSTCAYHVQDGRFVVVAKRRG